MKFLQSHSFVILIITTCFLQACKPAEQPKQQHYDEEKVKQQFVIANQQLVVKENDEMDYYQKSHQLAFKKTTSGIRYYVYKASAKGDSIKNGDILTLHYTLSLLDGKECYSSKAGEPKQLRVGMDDAESGLHKAMLFLKNGDKAKLLIPSHLAHGLLGDSKKIPAQSPIVYDIEILDVAKNK